MGKPGYHNRTRSLLHKGSTMLYVAQSPVFTYEKGSCLGQGSGLLG